MQSRATIAYQAGVRLYEARQYEPLRRLLEEALSLDPDSGRLIELGGLLAYAQGRFGDAVHGFERASLLVALSIEAQLRLAELYARGGRKADARMILAFLASRPDMAIDHLPILAAGLGRIGEYQLALDACREALRREPDFDEALFGMAFYMHMLDYPNECILPLFRRALSLAPDSDLYRLSLAMMCARAESWQEAYRLCCDLELHRVRCANCLKFMLYVFNKAGDRHRGAACLHEIATRAGTDGEAPAGPEHPRNPIGPNRPA